MPIGTNASEKQTVQILCISASEIDSEEISGSIWEVGIEKSMLHILNKPEKNIRKIYIWIIVSQCLSKPGRIIEDILD